MGLKTRKTTRKGEELRGSKKENIKGKTNFLKDICYKFPFRLPLFKRTKRKKTLMKLKGK